ncbi:MBL fold metallo-hydrolase [Halodurantibacterium flavum]|uniref:MBL fold metallo-hydrolase n=1 Tax=Halodurantibacterium flavum TaxID=1382802 RepID=A0ABW4S535_9RHOB
MDGTLPESVETLHYPWPDPPAEGEATEVAPGVLWMRLPLPMRLDHVNVYALDDGDHWTIVDTGFDNPRSRELWQVLLDGPLAGKPVGRLIVTHHHPDHIGLAGWFQSRGATLWTSRTAWLYARMLTLDVQERPSAEMLAFWRAAGMDAAILARRAASRPVNFADMVSPLPLGFHDLREGGLREGGLREGGTVAMAGRDWDIRLGDGHAPDHVTLWSRDCPLVIGGDQLLPSISPNLGVHATEPDADPVADWLASCRRFQAHARTDQLVLPGHKLPYTGLPLRLRQLIENHEGALARLLDFLDQPRRATECFAPLFKRGVGEGEYGFAMAEAVAHLNHLLRLGQVTRRTEDGVWLWQRTDVQMAR